MDVIFSPEELEAIDRTIEEIDAASNELLLPLRTTLKEEDWDFVVRYLETRLRSALEIGLIARNMCRVAYQRGLADERGLEHFLRSKAWVHNFGIPQTGDEYLQTLSAATGHRLVKTYDGLLEIAQDRMFGTIDEEYQRLLASDG